MLGGGNFLIQNKVLPGSYINFVAATKATATLSDRGTVAMAIDMDWGADGEVLTVGNADFQKDSLKIFGYDYTTEGNYIYIKISDEEIKKEVKKVNYK